MNDIDKKKFERTRAIYNTNTSAIKLFKSLADSFISKFNL